jgi:ribosomal protein L11 methyltransferase
MSYLRQTYLVRAGEEEDALVAGLWEAGTLGVEVIAEGDGRVRLEAYFPAGGGLVAGLGGVEVAGEVVVEEKDWLAPYRERALPFRLGRRFVVDPREPSEEAAVGEEGRWLLRLPARRAFGIGSHESTRLALELLEEAELGRGGGVRVLEVGTGTGILAFAALLLGARSVVAFDVDPVAVFHARENGALNGFAAPRAPRLFVGRVDSLGALADSERFDLAVANAIPEEIANDLPEVVGRLAVGGELILSGLLAERADELLARLEALGLAELARRSAGEWAALRLARRGG